MRTSANDMGRTLRGLLFAAATAILFVLPSAFAQHHGGGGHAGGGHIGGGSHFGGGGYIGGAAHFNGRGHVGPGAHFGGQSISGGHMNSSGQHFSRGGAHSAGSRAHTVYRGAASHGSSQYSAPHTRSGVARFSGGQSHRGGHFGNSVASNHSSGAAHSRQHPTGFGGQHSGFNHGSGHKFGHHREHHSYGHGHHGSGFFYYQSYYYDPFLYSYGYPYSYGSPYSGSPYSYGYPSSYDDGYYGDDVCDPNSPYYDPDSCNSLDSQNYDQGYDRGQNPVPATQPTRQNQYPLNQNIDPDEESSTTVGMTQVALQTSLTNSPSSQASHAAPFGLRGGKRKPRR